MPFSSICDPGDAVRCCVLSPVLFIEGDNLRIVVDLILILHPSHVGVTSAAVKFLVCNGAPVVGVLRV